MNAELRIGDTERDAAVTALGEHFAAGRIDKGEYDERTAAAWSARTSGALAPLFADLPETPVTPSGTGIARTDEDRGASPGRARRGLHPWAPLAGVLVISLFVTLAATDEIPWFAVAIAAWIVWIKMSRVAWHRSRRHWHHHGWGDRPARW